MQKADLDKLQRLQQTYESQNMSEMQVKRLQKVIQKAKLENDREYYAQRRNGWIRYASLAAALLTALVILPNTSVAVANAMEKIPGLGQLLKVITFRNYSYESERNNADIVIPELVLEHVAGNEVLEESLKQTIGDINVEIEEITGHIVQEFESGLEQTQGYQSFVVKSEVLATTEDYFTLKVLCYQGAGSGYQWNYYYTINLNTGKRISLQDMFVEDSAYKERISENIKEQMRLQMELDNGLVYWLDTEYEGLNFETITEDTSFYINEKGNLVIGFNEGDVAPMYMGTLEFEIPGEALKDLKKESIW